MLCLLTWFLRLCHCKAQGLSHCIGVGDATMCVAPATQPCSQSRRRAGEDRKTVFRHILMTIKDENKMVPFELLWYTFIS